MRILSFSERICRSTFGPGFLSGAGGATGGAQPGDDEPVQVIGQLPLLDVPLTQISVGVQSLRTSGYSAAGDGGGALYRRVAAEPTHPAKVQSADGGWWEIVPENDRLNVLQFGAVRTTDLTGSEPATDSLAAFQNALEAAEALGRPEVIVPRGGYAMSDTLEISNPVRMTCPGAGLRGHRGANLHFPEDTRGIQINRSNTSGTGLEDPADNDTNGGDESIFDGLFLSGKASGPDANETDGSLTANGWHIRARAKLVNCHAGGFAGHGFCVYATMGSAGDSAEGNANQFYLDSCSGKGNGLSGFYAQGADSNAGVTILFDGTGNGRWGIHDSSFLGNTHIAAHVANNGGPNHGYNGSDAWPICDYNGKTYAAVSLDPSALASTTPGTNSGVWRELTATQNNGQPDWETHTGTFHTGGPIRSDSENGGSSFFGIYTEPNHVSPVLLVGDDLYLGGHQGEKVEGGTAFSDGAFESLEISDVFGRTIRLPNRNDSAEHLSISSDAGEMAVRTEDGGATGFTGFGFGGRGGFYFTDNNGTTRRFGHSSQNTIGAAFLYYGAMVGDRDRGRHFTIDNVADSTSIRRGRTWGATARAVGDWVLSGKGTIGEPMGWVCTTEENNDNNGVYTALPNLPFVDGAVTLPSHTVSELEALSLPSEAAGTTVYCTDGDGGSPCLAVFNGTDWRRIALGAAVSVS